MKIGYYFIVILLAFICLYNWMDDSTGVGKLRHAKLFYATRKTLFAKTRWLSFKNETMKKWRLALYYRHVVYKKKNNFVNALTKEKGSLSCDKTFHNSVLKYLKVKLDDIKLLIEEDPLKNRELPKIKRREVAYDAAIIFTGSSTPSSMCDKGQKHALVRDVGLGTTSILVAVEIANMLTSKNSGKSSCNNGKRLKLSEINGMSKKELDKFRDDFFTKSFDCTRDVFEPEGRKFKFTNKTNFHEKYFGRIFNKTEQCWYLAGPTSHPCGKGTCEALYCHIGKDCRTLTPPLDGTSCDRTFQKACLDGQCVKFNPKIVFKGMPYTECTRDYKKLEVG
ncbi:hypothetical protein HELRODRAFT_179255 [Helobdella robusta]|uniref:ADAMTS cysteine-rich domain-containing protein n=1 Tax=Helobdella robusta TaxID=6412 RepID=T1FEF7_HELRO|nr:hypothetical protein HELRODRAFT_179255 [Helobdella robusta]ESN95485.1 hypothetical protein HELRODRAFT_179255 [Helobdella robusta]